MSENKKPWVCEVLGVEIGEEWTVPERSDRKYRMSSDGYIQHKNIHGVWVPSTMPVSMLADIINGKCEIKHKPRWTEDDIADAKAVRRLWPEAWSVKNGWACMEISDGDGTTIAYLGKRLFPSIQPNKTVALDVILEAEK